MCPLKKKKEKKKGDNNNKKEWLNWKVKQNSSVSLCGLFEWGQVSIESKNKSTHKPKGDFPASNKVIV